MDIATVIDQRNNTFIERAKQQFLDLARFTTEALEWLMMEHYQFSLANTRFLAAAADRASAFDTDAIEKELTRNCEEENGHAAMYTAALRKIGVNVKTRTEFASTSQFLSTIGGLVARDPSSVLGTMFATETAAIFEHEVFLDISREVIRRRKIADEGADLLHFHAMHLGGIEQSHRDELGVFLHVPPDRGVATRDGERPTIYPHLVVAGGRQRVSDRAARTDRSPAPARRCRRGRGRRLVSNNHPILAVGRGQRGPVR